MWLHHFKNGWSCPKNSIYNWKLDENLTITPKMLVNEMIPSLGVKTKCSEVSANNGLWCHLGDVTILRYEKTLYVIKYPGGTKMLCRKPLRLYDYESR